MSKVVQVIVLVALCAYLCCATDEVLNTRETVRVDDLLNELSIKEGYLYGWNSSLDLVRLFTVAIGKPVDKEERFFEGATIGSKITLSDGYHWIAVDKCDEEITGSSAVYRDFTANAYYRVTVKYMYETKGTIYVGYKKPISADNVCGGSETLEFTSGYHLVSVNSTKEYTSKDPVESDIELSIMNTVTSTGEATGVYYGITGERVFDVSGLKTYFESSEYAVSDDSTKIVVSSKELLTKDMNVYVMKNISVLLSFKEVNGTDLACSIARIVKLDCSKVSVEVIKKDTGLLTIVNVPSKSNKDDILKAIEKIEKGECPEEYGALCGVITNIGAGSLSEGYRYGISSIILSVFLMLCFLL